MRTLLIKPFAAMTIFALAASSCATIVSKSYYPIYIKTRPAGASVTITDKRGHEVYKGSSPATATLKAGAGFFSKAEYNVKMTMPGHQERTAVVKYGLNGWYFGNLLFGGLIGLLIVDPATGAMWKVKDPVVDETLEPQTKSTTQAPSLKIMDIADVSAEMRTRLVKISD